MKFEAFYLDMESKMHYKMSMSRGGQESEQYRLGLKSDSEGDHPAESGYAEGFSNEAEEAPRLSLRRTIDLELLSLTHYMEEEARAMGISPQIFDQVRGRAWKKHTEEYRQLYSSEQQQFLSEANLPHNDDFTESDADEQNKHNPQFKEETSSTGNRIRGIISWRRNAGTNTSEQ